MNREIIDVSESREGFRITFDDGDTAYCCRYGGCELLGFNEDYFVVEDHDYYVVLDPDGEIAGMIQRLAGDLSTVTSNSVVIRDGDYLKSYSMNGNLRGVKQVI